MTEPRVQHSQHELQIVAKLLELLNTESDTDMCGFEGELQLYWCDIMVGKIAKYDTSNPDEEWSYFPEA
jgi:hypothetical protein